MAFKIASKAFEYGYAIPDVHTCGGDNLSPPLWWEGEPRDTVTYALILEDVDAPDGAFTHWIIYNIPADVHELEKIIPIQKNLDSGAIQGKNDFGKIGYLGPCPPGGEEHTYFFRLYALRKKLAPESITYGVDFYRAIEGLVLDKAEYMGKYYKNT
jgi:Raf kinase inhibitor-like YbhB/YbcL family protein